MTTLLDGNVLVALTVLEHVHHHAAENWLADLDGEFATCPITQGTLMRTVVRAGRVSPEALRLVGAITADRRHVFWPDDVSFDDVRMTGVMGHRQITDAYLAQLARRHGGRLATFDGGLRELHPDVVDLVPGS